MLGAEKSVLNTGVRVGLTRKVAFVQRPEGALPSEEESEKGNVCRGPEKETCLVRAENGRKASLMASQ